MRIMISWVTKAAGGAPGGHNYVDEWEGVWLHLKHLKTLAGSVCLERVDAPDIGPYSMSVTGDRGNFLVTLLETTEDDSDVRCYSNPTAKAEMVDVLSGVWDARQLTSDFDFVCRMVEEFFKTGDISKQWLN